MNVEPHNGHHIFPPPGVGRQAIITGGNPPPKRIKRDHKTVIAFSKLPATIEDVGELKEDLADAYEGLARRMVESITDVDITKINAYQRTIAAAAATDKMRLLRNQSTQNIATIMASAVIEAGKQWAKPLGTSEESLNQEERINIRGTP